MTNDKQINLNTLEEKLDEVLKKETTESLNNWLEQKKMKNEKQTPKEKAIELIDGFLNELYENTSAANASITLG